MSTYDASIFNSTYLDATASSSSLIYKRDASMPLNITRDSAAFLGTLTYNQTQLDVTGQLSRENATHFYKFALDGDQIKMSFLNNTASSDLRVQVMTSSGRIIADSSTSAVQSLQDNYAKLYTDDGLKKFNIRGYNEKVKEGDYYIKVSFDTTSRRSVPQTYSLALYSGTRFTTSYQTTAKSQTSTKQAVLVDDTMTYSLIDAKAYETKGTHIGNETAMDAINIGWIFENKSALSVTSQLTSVCKDHYYSFTLQKGDKLKMAFNNKTATSETRVQLFDSSGYHVLADSHGTEAQKEAYAKLTSSEGLGASDGRPYTVKVSYVDGEPKNKQIYELKLYSGESYDAVYKTVAGTESAEAALANGRFSTGYTMKTAAATYLYGLSQGEEFNIFDAFS